MHALMWSMAQGLMFLLEGNTGKAIHTRSRLFIDQEWAQIEAQVMRDLA